MKRFSILPLFLFMTLLALHSQDGESEIIPREYGGIRLGSSLEDVKNLLEAHPDFSYQNDLVVELRDRSEEQLIEAPGSFFIDMGFFQFRENILVGITLMMNTTQLDHYSFFTHLYDKYGRPSEMDPQLARWSDESTYMVLEKPLTIKYLDLRSIQDDLREGIQNQSIMEITREAYVGQF